MAEAKNSFIKSKMNKDLDERLIPNNEYRDALNVAVSRSEGSDVGALEVVIGNGTTGRSSETGHKIIGTYADEANNRLYYFRTNWNSQSRPNINSGAICTIGFLNTLSNSDTTIVSGYFLNFSQTHLIHGISLIENQLFFTDNRNQPRKINVDTATADPSYYFNEDQISVAKFAPYTPPHFLNLRAQAEQRFVDLIDPLYPSTMSDAADPQVVEIGTYKISQSNLAVKKYRNGDEITEARTLIDWQQADTDQKGAWCYYANYNGNGVTYGLLYNKWAVMDARGLAPIGHRIPSVQDWNNIISAGGTIGSLYKSPFLWDDQTTGYVAGTNLLGTNILPGGMRQGTSTYPDGFTDLTARAGFWTSDAITAGSAPFVDFQASNTIDTTLTASTIRGYSVRVLRNDNYTGWNGDPDFLTERFVRFAYRFKFDDNEYSIISPFSQDVFIPYQEGEFVNEDENEAFITTVVEFMQNSINNAVLNIELPCIDIINNYKIKSIDIIFKQSDTQAYQVIETVRVDSNFIASLNNTNIYQYSYESTIPIKTLPAVQSTRVFDKVPVKALAQETAGNRIIYGNYLEGYSAPNGLDYYVGVDQKSAQQFIEYPQHHIKQNRNYQVGIILADRYGRQTDIVLSNFDGVLDENGDPRPGSNYFNDYKDVGFANDLPLWHGDNLVLNYLQQIPEGDIGISGYPGVYAKGNYYEVDTESTQPPSALYPTFIPLSTQYFKFTSTNAGTTFDSYFTYADATDSSNTFNVYIDYNNGFKLIESTEYTISDNSNYLRVTLNTAITAPQVVKVEILYTSDRRYKYSTGAASSTNRPLFPDWPTTYSQYYAPGKKLNGLYIDYTEITSVTPISDANGVRAVEFFTKEEVSLDYVFDNSPGSATTGLPAKTGLNVYATYDINPNGFFVYKTAVKQQQQDYYNVFLPGIVNGYPIDEETLEQNEVANIVLITDNINKIPRNLEDVGPNQNQFTSDVSMWPRVTNIPGVESTTVTYETFNKQVDPESAADQVNLVGGINDLYPGLSEQVSPGFINRFSIYSFDTKPVLAKISTQKAVGLGEQSYTQPDDINFTGNYPYPPNMGLAIYETAPYISPLEIFYESSTSDKISDLNLSIQNTSNNITGLNSFTVSFIESMASGTAITSDIFPVANGVNLANTTLVSYTVFAHDANGNLDTTIPQASRFVIEPGGSTGSYIVKTNDRFYAGSSQEPNYDVATRGKFQFTLTLAQLDGTQVDQSFIVQLENVVPIVQNPIVDRTGSVLTTSTTIVTSGNSPRGRNGSARQFNAPYNDSDPTGREFLSSSLQSGWQVVNITKTNATTGNTVEVTTATTPSVSDWVSTYQSSADWPTFQEGQAGGSGADEWIGFNLSGQLGSNGQNPGPLNEPNYSYEINMSLKDSLQAYNTTVDSAYAAKITYSVGVTTYFGQVIIAKYSNSDSEFQSVLSGTTVTGTATKDGWYQMQNWTDQPVYIYAYCSIRNTNGATKQSTFQYPLNPTTAPRYGNNSTNFTDSQGNSFGIGTGNSVPAAVSLFSNNYYPPPPNGPGSTGDAAGPYQWIRVGDLQPFTAASGGMTQTNFDLAVAAGLRPGMRSSGGSYGSYDFSACAMVNIGFRANSNGATGDYNLVWNNTPNSNMPSPPYYPGNPGNQPPVSSSLTSVTIDPPMYVGSNGQVSGYPTIGMSDSAGQFIGP